MYASDGSIGSLTTLPVDSLRYDGQSDDPDEVAGILRAMMPTGVRVLDVGCGTGSVTLIANHGKGNTVVAIEPDHDRCAKARSRGIDARQGFLDARFVDQNGLFDVVMSADVLEHMVDPDSGLTSFKRSLKPDGILLISVPNVAHWSVRLNLLRGRFQYEPCGIMDATHLRWFTQKTLLETLRLSGFDVLKYQVTAGYDLPVYLRGPLRRIPSRLRRWTIRNGIKTFPRLFGTQFVLLARHIQAKPLPVA